ncbi:NCS cytosine-purine permease [Infundibulicybe gibba]|nr:NCS cytosine-purine permease [Infundibulicybe gibba]
MPGSSDAGPTHDNEKYSSRDGPWQMDRWAQQLLRWGVESRGVRPVPLEERTDTQYSKIFLFSAGTLGPAVFGLGLRDTCLVILFFNILCTLPPAYLYYGVILPCVLNLIGMCGFCILNCILGGQTLASVAGGNLSWTSVSFCGYKVLSWYEKIAWIPVLITFLNLATASAVLTFGSTIAGFVITYSPLSSDFTNYFHPEVSSLKIFLYSYLGFFIPIVTIQCYTDGNVGGLLEAMLQPTGNFGKFLTVLLSLSVAGNIAATLYSVSLNIQVFIPPLVAVPRYFFSILAAAIIIPLAIVGSHRFYGTLTNFLGLIGYWAGAFCGIVLVEHLVFRRGKSVAYNAQHWNSPRNLPSGVAAIGAALASFGLVVPCMDQVWFVGPIAKFTGDIGFEVSFALSAILYVPFRALEVRLKRAPC